MAKVFPINKEGPAKVDNDGVLDQFVRLPCNDSPTNNRYVEKWKGPYAKAKEIPSKIEAIEKGRTIKKVHELLGNDICQRYEIPSCPKFDGKEAVWIVDNCSIEECEAGAHAILTITFKNSTQWTAEGESQETDLPSNDIWSITWQPYTVSPYAFCKNTEFNQMDYLLSPAATSISQADKHWEIETSRSALDSALKSPIWTIIDDCIVFTPDSSQPQVRFYLPAAFTKIWEKIVLDRNAIYHTPVITHQTTTVYNKTSTIFAPKDNNVGIDIDTIVTLPLNCPYTLANVMTGEGLKSWQWIKTADNVTCLKDYAADTVSYTRTIQYNGYPSGTIDKNYYGNDAFKHTEDGLSATRWLINGV